MKSTKTNKGITLIALIITIVVLLILAVVAISSITNDGILHYAQNAADSWNKASQNEAGILQGYLDYLPNDETSHEHVFEIVSDDENQYFFVSKCKICDLICEHESVEDKNFSDDMRCGVATYCAGTCKELLDDYSYAGDHSYDENSVCYNCGYTCTHEDTITEGSCWKCGYSIACEAHEYNDEGICKNCGSECSHSGGNVVYGYVDLGDEHGYNLEFCDCGLVYVSGEISEHDFSPTTGACVCGAVGEHVHVWDDAEGNTCVTCEYVCAHPALEGQAYWDDYFGDHAKIQDCSICNGKKYIKSCVCGGTYEGCQTD